MVQDQEGRWWAKSRETGEWDYNSGSTWITGAPWRYRPGGADPPRGRQSDLPDHQISRRRIVVAILLAIFLVFTVVAGFVLAAVTAGVMISAGHEDIQLGSPLSFVLWIIWIAILWVILTAIVLIVCRRRSERSDQR
jgi:hypothetical protein